MHSIVDAYKVEDKCLRTSLYSCSSAYDRVRIASRFPALQQYEAMRAILDASHACLVLNIVLVLKGYIQANANNITRSTSLQDDVPVGNSPTLLI